MLHSRAALIFALAATNVALAENTPGAAIKVSSSSQVCSTSGCLQGKSSSPLLAHDPSANKYLLPGTYTTTTGLSPVSSLNATITHSPSDLDTVVISPPSFPVAFTSPSYAGSPSTWEEGGWETKNWRSVFLPDDWYAILDGGNVVWGAVPEKMGWPDSIANSNIPLAIQRALHMGLAPSPIRQRVVPPAHVQLDGLVRLAIHALPVSGARHAFAPQLPPKRHVIVNTGPALQHQGVSVQQAGLPIRPHPPRNATFAQRGSSKTPQATASLVHSAARAVNCNLGQTPRQHVYRAQRTFRCRHRNLLRVHHRLNHVLMGHTMTQAHHRAKAVRPPVQPVLVPLPPIVLLALLLGSTSKALGVFVVNNAKSECDACPVGCLNCHIPSFSSVADYDTLTCSACQEGWLMEDGNACSSAIHRAVPAYHQPRPVLHVRLRPPSPLSALASPHVHHRRSLRTEHVYYVHPIAHHVPHQQPAPHVPPLDLYYPVTDDVPTSVLLLIRDDSKSCTACPDGFTLKEGTCYALSCNQGGFASGLGICLSDLVQSSFNKSYLGFIAFLALIIPGGVGIWWYIRRERRQTREDTKQFGERLDSKAVKDRLDVLRLESVLGLNRLRCGSGRNGGVDEEGKYDEGRRMRFRNLLLPSKRNRQANNDVELSSKSHHDRQRAGWSVPPPPYVPSLTSPPHSSESDTKTQHAEWSSGLTAPRGLRDSLDSIPTPVLAGFSASQPSTAAQEAERQRPSSTYMLGNTIVHSLSTGPSSSLEPAVQPTPTFGGLLPPPRPGMVRQSSMPSKEREVSRLTTGAEDGMGVERRLRDLWPALNDGSGRREEEGYI
nr:uncharacterized protein CI109_001917 [Kwoniella shandongensis]KAA5529492.1 hypothetical protein CI109_001917 [Kwoniella shandongensis]